MTKYKTKALDKCGKVNKQRFTAIFGLSAILCGGGGH